MDDMLAVEEPLEIRIGFESVSERIQKSISVTMRTPGNDFELALVAWIDQLGAFLIVIPFLWQRTRRNLGVEGCH